MDMLADVGLDAKASDIAGQLSRGDKRRLELAMCLVQKPKLLLLDEPTAGMARADTNDTIDLMKRIASTGVTMVVIEHDMHVVFSLAETITVLAQGNRDCGRACRRTSRATPASRKPISEAPIYE